MARVKTCQVLDLDKVGHATTGGLCLFGVGVQVESVWGSDAAFADLEGAEAWTERSKMFSVFAEESPH